MWCIHAKEYFAALKKVKGILTYSTKLMNLEEDFAKWHKPAIKREILYDSIYIKYNNQNHRHRQ